MTALVYPTLFSSEEVDEVLAKQYSMKAVVRVLPDAEQLIHSIATISRSYPTIASRIEATWGSEELHSYLAGLGMGSTDQHGNQREGFPPVVMEHLLLLFNLNFRSLGKTIPLGTWGPINRAA